MPYRFVIQWAGPIARHRINLIGVLLEGRIAVGDTMRVPLHGGMVCEVKVLGFDRFRSPCDPAFLEADPEPFALTFLRVGIDPADIVIGGSATG